MGNFRRLADVLTAQDLAISVEPDFIPLASGVERFLSTSPPLVPLTFLLLPTNCQAASSRGLFLPGAEMSLFPDEELLAPDATCE
jgi:hypothetical protein